MRQFFNFNDQNNDDGGQLRPVQWFSLLTQTARADWHEGMAQAFTEARSGEDPTTALHLIGLAKAILPPPEDPRLHRLAALGAERAVLPQDFAYHNTHHSREVLALAIAQLHHHVKAGMEPALTGNQIWEVVAAAVSHDIGYVGGGNKLFGEHTPMYLEETAVNTLRFAASYDETLSGLPAEHFTRIHAMTMPTDVSGGAGISPGSRLGANFDDASFTPVYPHEALLATDPTLREGARIISDADLAGSAALDLDFALARTAEVAAEMGGKPGPKAFLGFMQFVAGDFPHSHAGQALFAAQKDVLIAKAGAAAAAPALSQT